MYGLCGVEIQRISSYAQGNTYCDFKFSKNSVNMYCRPRKKRLSSGRNRLPHNSIHSVSVCCFLPTIVLFFQSCLSSVIIKGIARQQATTLENGD